MQIDPYIFSFSALTVIATIWMGFWSARKSKTASDFFVAGRSVSVGWNASAISGEYLSAASFMGVAGMVMSSGYDALWYPVCYACGYLFLLLFIAGPLRRFGAYTIPDFAEGRFDSPVFRKIAVVFVLFIGFFYTMPQMKGAGTTLAYIFPGLPYWAGVVLVGVVITLNVALGGMKGITLVQAFQYWAKMFAISVPIFILMSVYGHYGKQVGLNGGLAIAASEKILSSVENDSRFSKIVTSTDANFVRPPSGILARLVRRTKLFGLTIGPTPVPVTLEYYLETYGSLLFGKTAALTIYSAENIHTNVFVMTAPKLTNVKASEYWRLLNALCASHGVSVSQPKPGSFVLYPAMKAAEYERTLAGASLGIESSPRTPELLQELVIPSEFETLPVPEAFRNQAADLGLQLREFSKRTGLKVFIAESLQSKAIPGTGDSFVVRAQSARSLGEYEEILKNALESGGMTFVKESARVLIVPLRTKGLYLQPEQLTTTRKALPDKAPPDETWLNPFGPLTTKAAKAANLSAEQTKPYALLYTYSLIIALVCGTAGLPHILVRFYTNPDGVAAKRTTMWVMILIGVFYLFPPVFGVMGRNLLPDLYAASGAKGTDKVVLELPRILNSMPNAKSSMLNAQSTTNSLSIENRASAIEHRKGIPWGSILSGITCAGAFAAFMSTFSGLLVSMTGALAHDVYGRILRPSSTPRQRLIAFKISAIVIGAIAILLGMQVEQLQINFMVGQAFAIAAASYFPLLFMSVWWRGMTTKGAATGMLAGGSCALAAVTLTNFSDLKWIDLTGFWAAHPLARILSEQPAIWTVPLAIGLMVIISKLTRHQVPADVRMKMLVLHAPEQLGLKQEYIQEHGAH